MTNWANMLNSAQCAAVTAPDGPILVLAAAGTGKTRTLTYRVAYLLEHNVPPEEILLLTFTNRAAREMMVRAEQLIGGAAFASMWAGTFHHVCHKILRTYAQALGYSRSFTILDRSDALSLLNKCLKGVVADIKHFPKKEVVAALISKAANTQTPLRDIIEQTTFKEPIDPEQVITIASRYEEAKRQTQVMDFDDLLVLTLRLFQENPGILARYAQQFRYVLVDEYQDTNTIQAQLVDALASEHHNLMAVGDDFQCIYTWRGADFKNIMEFPKRWNGCRIIKLEQNYRSVPEILNVANAVIAGNPEQFQKTLLPTRPPLKRKPLVTFLRDADEQSQMVIRHIQRALEAGYKPEDIAVLYRSHFHVMELELTLRRLQISYVLTSGQGVFESAHIKDVLAFLRLCTGKADFFAFSRILGLLPGVGEKTAERLWQKMGGVFDSSQVDQRTKMASLIPKKAQADWATINGLLGHFHQTGLAFNGNKTVTLFLNVWYEAYLRRTYEPEDAEERAADVATLAATQFENGAPIHEFLNDVALMTNVDAETNSAQQKRTGIHLSTVHQAKGLEWPLVIVLWCNEEMFPSGKAINEGNEAEERRLFYVAVTRAKDDLLFCAPAMRALHGNNGMQYLQPSRFLKELPPSTVSRRYGMY